MFDLTRMPLGAAALDGRRIEVCPLCGRHGTIRRRDDGSQTIVHSGEDLGIAYWVTEYCFQPLRSAIAPAAR